MNKTSSQQKPKLECTKNYDIFEMHETNRPVKEKHVLLDSMRKYGFMPSGAIHCYRNGNGKLKIIRGHHRFHYAQRLKLPVYYIVDDTQPDIFGLEGDSSQTWNSMDFVSARAKAGNKNYIRLLGFMNKHRIPLGAATHLMMGESCEGGRATVIKSGMFKIDDEDTEFAGKVAKVIDSLRDFGVPFCTSGSFVSAVALCVYIPEFDLDQFQDKIGKFHGTLRKCMTRNEYLDEIESLYNHQSQKNRLPIKFRALEVARERSKSLFRPKATV